MERSVLRPIGALWVLLSVAVGTSCVFAFLQPVWLTRSEGGGRLLLGLWNYCHLSPALRCFHYRRDALDAAWLISCFLIGLSSTFLFLSGLLAFPTICVGPRFFPKLMKPVQRLQIFSLGVGAAGMLGIWVHPGGHDFLGCSHSSGPLLLGSGSCEVGWAMTLWSVCSLLGLFCPLLAGLSTFPEEPGYQAAPLLPPHKEYFI